MADLCSVLMCLLIFWTQGSLSKVTLLLSASVLPPPDMSTTVKEQPENDAPPTEEGGWRKKIYYNTCIEQWNPDILGWAQNFQDIQDFEILTVYNHGIQILA